MRVLMPLPDHGFDVTEVAVPWHVLTRAGHDLVFATERGDETPAADPLLLRGVLMGLLGARPEPIAFLRERVAEFWKLDRPVAAICHGVLVMPGLSNP